MDEGKWSNLCSAARACAKEEGEEISGKAGGRCTDVGLRLDLKSLTTTCIESPTARLKFDNFSLRLRTRDALGRETSTISREIVDVGISREAEADECSLEVEGAG